MISTYSVTATPTISATPFSLPLVELLPGAIETSLQPDTVLSGSVVYSLNDPTLLAQNTERSAIAEAALAYQQQLGVSSQVAYSLTQGATLSTLDRARDR